MSTIHNLQKIQETTAVSDDDLLLIGTKETVTNEENQTEQKPVTRVARVSNITRRVSQSAVTSESIENALGYVPTATKVKGNAEETYRTGEVNLTPENIGLGNVNNTSDEDKPISTAQQEEFGKKVNKTDIMQGATSTAAGKAGLVPAPKAGNTNRALMSNGFFEDTNSFMSSKINANIGWWTICEIGTDSNLSPNNILLMVTGYSADGFSSFLVNISEVGYYNYANCKTLSIRTNPNGVVGISKIRKVTVSGKTLYQVYANVNCDFSIRVITSPLDITYYKTAVADGGEGSVIYEYTIPDKDDFDTSKSLTRFEEIPSGADLKSDKYLVPGNYCCPLTDIAHSLVNCPINTAFSLEVKYAVGTTAYIEQAFYEIYSSKIVKRSRLYDGTWTSNSIYYPITGTPPANKLWGTDANGNVGWIDPP